MTISEIIGTIHDLETKIGFKKSDIEELDSMMYSELLIYKQDLEKEL